MLPPAHRSTKSCYGTSTASSSPTVTYSTPAVAIVCVRPSPICRRARIRKGSAKPKGAAPGFGMPNYRCFLPQQGGAMAKHLVAVSKRALPSSIWRDGRRPIKTACPRPLHRHPPPVTHARSMFEGLELRVVTTSYFVGTKIDVFKGSGRRKIVNQPSQLTRGGSQRFPASRRRGGTKIVSNARRRGRSLAPPLRVQ